MKDLYKILGIEKTALPEEVKKAYFEMAKKYHPDSADETEVQKFYEIAEAYQILSDDKERRAYDLTLGGGKIEKVLVDETPAHPTIFKEEAPKDEEFRKKEMYRFRRAIFWKGVFRVMGFSILMSVFGYVLAFILGGVLNVGLLIGFAVGLVWGVNRNFDVSSFIKSSKKQLFVRIIGWGLLVGGVGYFGWLLFLVITN